MRTRRIRYLSRQTVESHFPGDGKPIVRLRRAGVREQIALERAAPGTLPQRDRRSGGLRCETRRGSCAVNQVNVAVAVAEDARVCIYEVAAACRALGLDHTATLTEVGVLTGSVELDSVAKLWAVPGVVAVEVECESQAQITEWARRPARGN